MKLYVFFLSFVLAFLPSLSYAFAPIAIAGSIAGRVAIQNGAGAVIKKVSPTAKQGLIKNAIALCKANVLAMKACSDILGDMLDDDIEVENKTTINNDIEVEIYRRVKDDECRVKTRYVSWNDGIRFQFYSRRLSAVRKQAHSAIESHVESSATDFFYRDFDKIHAQYQQFLLTHNPTEPHDYIHYNGAFDTFYYENGLGRTADVSYGVAIQYAVECYKSNDKDYLSDDEIEEYWNKRADGDDITNIYNYDYSKHDNITINNKTESGDTINNYKNDFDKNEIEKNVSSNATEKMKNKRKGYDVDEINDENCEKNDKGEYDKCGDDRGKKDGEDSEEPKKDDTEEQPKKEDEKSDFCKMIPLICDLSLPSLPNVEVPTKNISLKNPVEFDKDYLSVRAECPPDVVRDIPLPGQSFQLRFELSPVCDFAGTYLRPVIIFMAYIWGALSIGNAFKVG